MTRKNIKITCAVAIAIFLFLQIPLFNLKLFSAVSYSLTAAALFDILYDRTLWKLNPLEKTPRIFGTYFEESISTHNGGFPYTARAIIKQTLSHISVYEEIENSGYAESVTATLVEPSNPDGNWKLYYTYLTHPPAGQSDDMHEGTVILQIKSNQLLEGTYFTNRMVPTKGNQKLTKISNKTK